MRRQIFAKKVPMAVASPIAFSAVASAARLTDSHGRVIHDLRVSITDRCNYKCVYCRTGELGAQYPELGIEEYLRLIKLFVGLGIEKVRLTGGEPLLYRDLDQVLESASRAQGIETTLCTNGTLLDSDWAARFRNWGLRINISTFEEP